MITKPLDITLVSWTGNADQLAARWGMPPEVLTPRLKNLGRSAGGRILIDLDTSGTVALSRLRAMIERAKE